MLRLRPHLLQTAHRSCLRYASTSSSKQNLIREQTKQPVESAAPFGDIKITVPAGKLPARQPLVKNFFAGIVDKELLAYPEVVPRDRYEKLHKNVLPLKQLFDEHVNSAAADLNKLRTIPTELLEQLQALGIYGFNVPDAYDGNDYGYTESLWASEEEAKFTDVGLALSTHRVVIDVLKELGTAEQQKMYLSKLASGNLVGAEAIFEAELPEDGFFNTNAIYSPEDNTWTLNGIKSNVITGPLLPNAKQLFLVIAQTYKPNMQGDGKNSSTAFLVESTTAGVKLSESAEQTIGCQGAHLHSVTFKNVHLTADNILGKANDANAVAALLFLSSRLRHSMLALGICKRLLHELTEHFINHKQNGIALSEMELAKGYLSKATCTTYAIESMLYMSAGLLDEFFQQDVMLEAAIVKHFSIKQLFKLCSKMMGICGARSLQLDQSTGLMFRNAAHLYTYGESMETLELTIALMGLQHAGVIMQDTVKKTRNPLFHPGHIFQRFIQSSSIENPKSKMQLEEHLHPSLAAAAQCIEQSAVRLEMSVDLLFTRHGTSMLERHLDLQRLTEMATSIFAMYASTARASRSYCIGLYLADHELLTASTIASYGRDRVKQLAMEILAGPHICTDTNLMRLSNQIARSKGYFAVHPLTYNF